MNAGRRRHGVLWFIFVGWWWYLLFAWWVWIFRRKARSGRSEKSRSVVTVAYRELNEPAPPGGGDGYTYIWPFEEPAAIGDRVFVPTPDPDLKAAVVISLKPSPGAAGLTLKTVARKASMSEVRTAVEAAAADELRWLAIARMKAGLPVPGRAPRKEPNGFPRIPPVDGTASAADADHYGSVWWRVYKRAEEHHWPAEEIAVVRGVAHRWYAIRDGGSASR